MFNGLDHIAIVVADTDEALLVWRDTFGFPVVWRESVNDDSVLLTHLDLGNTHLQLVQPLTDNHPLWDWLAQHGSGLHHFCLKVNDVSEVMEGLDGTGLLVSGLPPHQGIQGKRALFLATHKTDGVRVELTGG